MKNKLIAIFTDPTFLLFLLLIVSNLLTVWLGYPLWWTTKYAWIAKYGMILWACNAAYILAKKGHSIFLLTTIIGTFLAVVYPFLP